MSSMIESLIQQISSQHSGDLAQAVGGNASQSQVQEAVAGAVPMLMSALAKNSASADGAGALLGALDRDHDGSVLDDLAGFFNKRETAGGDAILGHMLGNRRRNAETTIGHMSGLDGRQVASLLAMLAPLVMGALGKQRRSAGQGLDGGGLADLLRGERRRAEQAAPDAMGVFGKLLDQDGDGDMTDDLARLGSGLLGKMFGGR